MSILCTNDDGYLAEGLRVLAEAARSIGTVTVVAPDREQSATSHSLTLHHPLRVRRAADGAHVVDGTPTDCVLLAVNELLLDTRPGLCLSGVNHGPNMGEDVLYSGTVAAAMEATVLGIRSVAVSYTGEQYEEISAWTDRLAVLFRDLARNARFPDHTLLNVNLPAIDPADLQGVRITSLGRRRYQDAITRANDPRGREYFWIGGGVASWQGGEHSDFKAVSEGYISITPVYLDLTNYALMEELRTWEFSQ
ncbi:MAG: 5'/3'-nucleotidase SurE [Gemmatimonadota bacterium]